MKVIAYDPFLSPERAVKLGVEKVELDDLLLRADVISLHTPLTDKTKNILSIEALAKTKRGVIITWEMRREADSWMNPLCARHSRAVTSRPRVLTCS